MEASANKKRILILGGGFGGAYTALNLQRLLSGTPGVEVMVVSQENFILFTPMLHEVAGSDAAATDVVQPLRKMLRRASVVVGDVESIDLATKHVRVRQSDLVNHRDLTYDQLVLALGSVTNYYRTPGIEEYALTMKTLGDALLVRNRAIDALELADDEPDEAQRRALMTVVVAGGGFAGVETVGAVNDLLREALKFYNHLNENMLRIVLVHAGQLILPELGESLGRYAEKQLSRRGVEIHMNTAVKSYDGKEVVLSDGTRIASRMIIWTAGTTPVPIVDTVPCSKEHGHIVANEYLQVPDLPGVWALGDCALVPDLTRPGKSCPPTAQHATRQAAVLAHNIVAALSSQPLRPFKFKTLGLLATIGRRTGVAEIVGVKFSGIVAWWLWRAIYLSKLPGIQKKVRVALDWALDLCFSKDIVQLRALPTPTMSGREVRPTLLVNEKGPSSPERTEKIA
jgi:NADH:ubiquinone reductase (H+-translocating)